MHTESENEGKLNFPGMTARVDMYISRLARFPFRWGLPDSKPTTRPRLFRYDAKRMRGMIIRAEHMIRCLIIWLAHRKMRDEGVAPAKVSPLPTPGPGTSPEPAHPHFALRGLPLYDPKPAPFLISMPRERLPRPLGGEGHRVRGKATGQKRSRNDEISSHEKLYLRLERLDDLFTSVETRATRLAARWAGLLVSSHPPVIPESAQHLSGTRPQTTNSTSDHAGADGLSGTQRIAVEQNQKDHSGSRVFARDDKPLVMHQTSSPEHDPSRRRSRSGRSKQNSPEPNPSRERSEAGIKQKWTLPLQSHDPPTDLLLEAEEDEREDIEILHDVAFRAAEGFPALCG